MIRLENVTKEFGGNQVLKGINLNIKDGEVYGLVGRNGAGKTTLLNIIAGISESSSGTCTVTGKDEEQSENTAKSSNSVQSENTAKSNNPAKDNNLSKSNAGNLRKSLSYLPDLPSFYDYLTIEEYVEYLLGTDYEGEIADYIKALANLGFKTSSKIKSLSRGNRQKLGIYVATMKNPDIVLLDEPTSALDPVGRREVMELIKQLKKGGTTVILSTHILSDLEVVCDRIGFLNEGHIANEFDLHKEDVTAVCDYEVVVGVNVDDALIEDMNRQLPHFAVNKGFGVGALVCRFKDQNSPKSNPERNPKSNPERNPKSNPERKPESNSESNSTSSSESTPGSTPGNANAKSAGTLSGAEIQKLFLSELSCVTYPVSSVKKVSFVNLEELMVDVLTKK